MDAKEKTKLLLTSSVVDIKDLPEFFVSDVNYESVRSFDIRATDIDPYGRVLEKIKVKLSLVQMLDQAKMQGLEKAKIAKIIFLDESGNIV